MADFTQTVTNTIQVFGSADTENWNEIVWGTDNWAADDDMEFEITKLLANTVSATADLTFHAEHIFAAAVTATVVSTNVTLTLQDSNGYSYVFPSDTTNGSEISSGVFTNVTNASDGFSPVADASTTWSEA